jgi:integrase
MPRKGAGPRLWFDKARGTWTILDGKRRERTGCAERQTVEAQQALKAYIGEKHEVVATDDPCLADILTVYLDEHVPTLPQPVHGENPAVYRIASLAAWWGLKGLKDVTTANCRLYVAHREEENVRKAIETEIRIARREKRDPDIAAAEIDAPAGTVGARSDLEVLRAAMGYWHREKKPLKVLPAVWLPDKPEGRKQWCTRTQVAMLLWRSRRVVHNLEPDPTKRPRLVRHLSRFIITAFYTGSRSGVVLGTRYRMLDFENEYMQRKPHGARKSKKRAPAHKMPKRLKSWLLRWQRIDGSKADYVVHIHLEKITKLRRSWDTARDSAGLPDDVTPHTLRHSRATHLMRNRAVSNEDAAEFLGMTLQTFLDTYGHHDPEWQKDAADAR